VSLTINSRLSVTVERIEGIGGRWSALVCINFFFWFLRTSCRPFFLLSLPAPKISFEGVVLQRENSERAGQLTKSSDEERSGEHLEEL
jgi:hypothetical protein